MPNSHTSSAHLPVGALLDLAERPDRPPARPPWLDRFVDAAAELFDPHSGLGRVGYRSEPGEDGWAVALFLGATEIVGGPGDGMIAPARFRFDATALAELFDEPPSVGLEVSPQLASHGVDGIDAALSLRGTVEGRPLTATVLSAPPDGAEPGFKRYANGLEPPVEG
jgi:hypothetical protein